MTHPKLKSITFALNIVKKLKFVNKKVALKKPSI